MITINGPMSLCDTVSFAMTSGGTAQLTLSATAPNPSRPDGVAYLLVWTGDRAAVFFQDFGHALKLGASLSVIASDPRPLIDRGQTCIAVTVMDIQIVKQGTHPVTKDKPATRWVNLPEVTA